MKVILSLSCCVFMSCGDSGGDVPDTTVNSTEVHPTDPGNVGGDECAGGEPHGTDARCAGNVGCTYMGHVCGSCACTLCLDEQCLENICDDGGSPECPGCGAFCAPDATDSGG